MKCNQIVSYVKTRRLLALIFISIKNIPKFLDWYEHKFIIMGYNLLINMDLPLTQNSKMITWDGSYVINVLSKQQDIMRILLHGIFD